MLLAFVLLGRAVEERAKLRATSDMSALLNLLPPTARLIPKGTEGGGERKGKGAGEKGNGICEKSGGNQVRGAGAGAGAGGGAGEEPYFRTVPTSVIQAQDYILVLPGDRQGLPVVHFSAQPELSFVTETTQYTRRFPQTVLI